MELTQEIGLIRLIIATTAKCAELIWRSSAACTKKHPHKRGYHIVTSEVYQEDPIHTHSTAGVTAEVAGLVSGSLWFRQMVWEFAISSYTSMIYIKCNALLMCWKCIQSYCCTGLGLLCLWRPFYT